MKRKKLLDIIISCFLLSSLGLAAFIVSCSDQDNIISSNDSDRRGHYQSHVHGLRGETSSNITSLFVSAGNSAASEVGSVTAGWALSAMGLSMASGPNYEAEFQTINTYLGQIVTEINETNAELAQLNGLIKNLTCVTNQTSLQAAINSITTFSGQYQSILFDINNQDTIGLYQLITTFVNGATDITNTTSVLNALGTIKSNIGSTDNVIESCMLTIPSPANGTFRGDSLYYVQAQNILNYYYGNQAMALVMLTDAYHWQAWLALGAPGAGSGYSADTIQQICIGTGVPAVCVEPITLTNETYNTLLTELIQTGAPYTGEDLIHQRNLQGQDVVWVRSLEDFTTQAGSNCTYPLVAYEPCGPTFGKYGSTLSVTTYYNTQNFTFPSLVELNGLVDPTPNTTLTIGGYLDSIGFENMNSQKILLADTLVKIQMSAGNCYYFLDTMHIIPFISPYNNTYTNVDNDLRAIYSTAPDFIGNGDDPNQIGAMYSWGYENINDGACTGHYPTGLEVWWKGNYNMPAPFGFTPQGTQKICQYNGNDCQPMYPFAWNETQSAAAWSYYSTNSNPQDGLFIPARIDFSGSTGCLSGYNNTNSGGFITLCAEDFQNYLGLNLPQPPTCDTINSQLPPIICTSLP